MRTDVPPTAAPPPHLERIRLCSFQLVGTRRGGDTLRGVTITRLVWDFFR